MSLPVPLPLPVPSHTSLPLSLPESLRRGARASVAALALLCAAGAAHAQLTNPKRVPPGTVLPSGDAGMAPAEQAAAQKRYDDAIKGYDRVLAANPRNAQARFERAWAMAQAGRDDDAIQAFAEMAQDFPELPEPHNNLALLYAKRGDLKRAEAELLTAIQVKPDFAVAYTNLGDVYSQLASQSYAEALRRNPADARAASGAAKPAPASRKSKKPASPSGRGNTTGTPAAE